MKYPYTYISCPCTDITTANRHQTRPEADIDDGEEQERTFNPCSARANFSLYPIEHLLYCEDCQQLRCPRCTIEEIVCWYCPSCLFESTSLMVKSEGNRWVRLLKLSPAPKEYVADEFSDARGIASIAQYALQTWPSTPWTAKEALLPDHGSSPATTAVGPHWTLTCTSINPLT